MSGARNDLLDATAENHITGECGRFIIANIVCVSVAEDALPSATPATKVAVTQNGARVTSTAIDLYNYASDVDIADVTRSFGVTHIIGVTVTKRTTCPRAPAAQVA